MKKVAIFTGTDIRYFGGAERHAIETSMLLKDIQITFFSCRQKRGHRVRMESIGELTRSNVVYYNTILKRTPLTRSGIRAIDMIKDFDIICNYDVNPLTNIMLLRAARKYNKKLIFEMHNPSATRNEPIRNGAIRNVGMWFFRHIRDYAIFRIPNIRVINKDDMLYLRKRGYKGRIYYINDFTTAYVKKSDIVDNKKGFVALFVGRLDIIPKGLDLLSDIIEKTLQIDNSINFEIIGSGDNGEDFIRNLSENHRKNVKWFGFVGEKELREHYRNASLLLHTSRYETFGLTLLEAQTYGVPAIAFDIKGPRDIMQKEFQGKLIKKFNTDEYAKCIVKYHRLWKEHKINAILKRKISNYVIEKFGPRAILPKLDRMFTES